jgi:hypothetical protein
MLKDQDQRVRRDFSKIAIRARLLASTLRNECSKKQTDERRAKKNIKKEVLVEMDLEETKVVWYRIVVSRYGQCTENEVRVSDL